MWLNPQKIFDPAPKQKPYMISLTSEGNISEEPQGSEEVWFNVAKSSEKYLIRPQNNNNI